MSRNRRPRGTTGRPSRRVTVRAVRRDPPDIRRLSRAVIAIAMAQAQAEADASRQSAPQTDKEEPDDQ